MTPARCCWCKGKLGLDTEGIAWCAKTKRCRERQIQWGIRNGNVWAFLPTPRQVMCMEDEHRNLFVWGNRGGGKSVCFRWYCHAMALAIPGFKYAILRTSFPELEKNHLIYLEKEMEMFGPKDKSYFHKTNHICYYPNGSIGFYAQCETDADVEKILGAEVAMLVFDEAPTFQWEHMRLIGGSVRAKKGTGLKIKVRYLGNPVGESIDELWSYCIDKDVNVEESDADEDDLSDPEYDPDDWHSIEIRLEDNPYLDFAEYRKQFAGLKKHIRKAWLDGVRMEERSLFEFYKNLWDEDEDRMRPYHVVDELPHIDGKPVIHYNVETGKYEHPSWVKIYRAYDHGFSPDPAVCLWFAIVGRMVVCFKEIVRHRKIAQHMAQEIIEESEGMEVVTTYCDPSIHIQSGHDVHTTMQVMENEGMAMDPMVNDRELFADVIHRALGEKIGKYQPRFIFYERGCPGLIKYLPRMKWSVKNPHAMAEHKHDHLPVAFAYFAMSQIPTTKEDEGTKARRWKHKKKKKSKR